MVSVDIAPDQSSSKPKPMQAYDFNVLADWLGFITQTGPSHGVRGRDAALLPR